MDQETRMVTSTNNQNLVIETWTLPSEPNFKTTLIFSKAAQTSTQT